MAGRLIYLMGPSGSGKDSVLQGVQDLLGNDGYVAPRLITRATDCHERGAVSVSPTEFAQLECDGRLAMAWRANGLAYGVPRNIDAKLAGGCDVLVNGSREYLPQACRLYPDLLPVLLTVDSTLLHRRLQERGREDDARIGQRLARNRQFTAITFQAAGRPIFVLDNSGKVHDTVHALYIHLMHTRLDRVHSCG